jgi:hypothetical protein
LKVDDVSYCLTLNNFKQGGIMLRKRDLAISNEDQVTYFGIPMSLSEYQKIRRKLNLLEDRCPSQCSIKLSFEKRKSSYVGVLSIRSISENFYSRKIGHSPYQSYILLEEDIDQQLLEWKRRRFSSSVGKTINRVNLNSQSA